MFAVEGEDEVEGEGKKLHTMDAHDNVEEELQKPEEHDLNDVEVTDLKTGEIIRKIANS